MARWPHHAIGIFGVLSTAACTGSSCCSGPSMIDPLPNGFDKASTVENGATVRITSAGFQFVQENIGAISSALLAGSGLVDGGVVKFPIPTASLAGTGYNITLCPDGPDLATDRCVAEIDLNAPDRTFTTAPPHHIVAAGSIPLRIKSLPVQGSVLGVPVDVVTAVSGGGNSDCTPSGMTFKSVALDARVSIEVEGSAAHALRQDDSKLAVEQLSIDEQQVSDGLHACGGGLDAATINALKGALGPAVLGSFVDGMTAALNEQFCLQASATMSPACPAGTTESGGLCWYTDGTCVSGLLGFDGRARLSALFSGFSPGTRGGVDFVLAMGGSSARADDATQRSGDLNPVAGGATIGMLGGALPSPVAACVKPVELTPPPGIPIPAQLLANAPSGWTGADPHVGFALSERFANYFLGNAYNGGALCLGFSTDQVSQLSTSLFGLLVPSLKLLATQKQNAPILLQLRPQQPPAITIGGGTDLATDPLLRAKLEQVMVDLYVWSSDRFIRAFTLQGDLDVPVNLDVSADGVLPVLDKIEVANPVVTNSALMKESPQKIATGLADAISGLAGQFLGGLQPFDVSGMLAPLGLAVQLDAQSVRKLTEADDAYVGLFARLALPLNQAAYHTDTAAVLRETRAPAEGFRLDTRTEDNRPRVVVQASTSEPPASRVEYSWRLDRGPWHPWSSSPELVVDDPWLTAQGAHQVAVRSRLSGQPLSADPTPAVVSVVLDVDGPDVALSARARRTTRINAVDNVTPRESLEVRWQFDDRAWSGWVALGADYDVAAPETAGSLRAEVRDSSGNVTSVRRVLDGREARGQVMSGAITPPSSGSREPGGPESPFAYVGMGALALSLLLMQRKRAARRPAVRRAWMTASGLAALAAGGTWAGCNCLDDIDVVAPPAEQSPDAGATGTCGAPGADPCIVLSPGLIGSYTSADVAPDGTVWVSGYNEADWDGDVSYGDLVVGKWTPSSNTVAWEPVDGVPSDPAPDPAYYDVTSWRGGQDVPGDDVGRWSSLAVDASGHPRVAYFDATNGALKFASFDGSAWTVSTVYQKSGEVAGRYAKLVLADGKPVIAFQAIAASSGGFAHSRVVVARGASAAPDAGGWSFEDVAVDDQTPCRASLCPKDTLCVQSTLECTPQDTACDPKCASGQGCVDGACVPIFDATKLDTYPAAVGDGISMVRLASGQLGLVFYDRIRGNLVQASSSGGAWSTRVIDGESAGTPPVDTGNVGAGASLAVDSAGTWHVAYVDAAQRALRYVAIEDGAVAQTPELVDDGLGVGGQQFEDAWHAVGDDANITVSSAGEVGIAYQDATAGTLRYAIGTPQSGGGHSWSVKVIDDGSFTGFFPKQLNVGGQTMVATWWRAGGAAVRGDVRLVSP